MITTNHNIFNSPGRYSFEFFLRERGKMAFLPFIFLTENTELPFRFNSFQCAVFIQQKQITRLQQIKEQIKNRRMKTKNKRNKKSSQFKKEIELTTKVNYHIWIANLFP